MVSLLRFARGSMRVRLERYSFLPGERVVGSVAMQIPKPIQQARLVVRLVGEQSLAWLYPFGRTKRPYYVTADLVNVQTTLLDKQSLKEGDHEVPIAFQLSRQSPSSFTYGRSQLGDYEEVKATMAYKVEAEMAMDSLMGTNLNASVPFEVRPRLVLPQLPRAVGIVKETTIDLFGVFPRGSCGLDIQLASDTYQPHSTIEARVRLNLHTTSKPQFITLALWENAAVNSQGVLPPEEDRRVIVSQRFDAAPLLRQNDQEAVLRLPITPNAVYGSKPLLPTLTTKLLTLEYSVVVECHFAMASSVRADVPITIAPY